MEEPWRQKHLREIFEGFDRSGGVDLVAWKDGNFIPGGFSDDPGFFLFTNRLGKAFNLTVEQAQTVFIQDLVYLPAIIGAIGFVFLFRFRFLPSLIASACLYFLARLTVNIGDVYVTYFSTAVVAVPWFLYLVSREDKKKLSLLALFLFILGLFFGFVHLIRSHAATGPALFILVLLTLGLKQFSWQQRLALTGIFMLSPLLVTAWFKAQVKERDHFLQKHNPAYTSVNDQHPFWHNTYIGLGYIPNNHGIIYLDEMGAAKVKELNPTAAYLSPEYEQTLKKEYFRIFKEDPQFFAQTYWAKLKDILYQLLLPALGALVVITIAKVHRYIIIGFGVAVIFNFLFPLLAIPAPYYMLGSKVMAWLASLSLLSLFLAGYFPLSKWGEAELKRSLSTLRRSQVFAGKTAR